jgi:hypothetical protein
VGQFLAVMMPGKGHFSWGVHCCLLNRVGEFLPKPDGREPFHICFQKAYYLIPAGQAKDRWAHLTCRFVKGFMPGPAFFGMVFTSGHYLVDKKKKLHKFRAQIVIRRCSSVGQSMRLISAESLVQIQSPPPLKNQPGIDIFPSDLNFFVLIRHTNMMV